MEKVYLSILAAEARDQGKSLSETKAMIEDILPRLRTYFLVDDLYHLMRGGIAFLRAQPLLVV